MAPTERVAGEVLDLLLTESLHCGHAALGHHVLHEQALEPQALETSNDSKHVVLEQEQPSSGRVVGQQPVKLANLLIDWLTSMMRAWTGRSSSHSLPFSSFTCLTAKS